jgi:hypothetical protein
MLDGRRNDSMRRRQRVLAVLDRAAADGEQISASAIARTAGVDRTFLYRHRDLLEKIHALQADPAISADTGPAVTRASLQADLLAAHERAARLNTRIQHLEKRFPKPSANRPGASPGSAHPPTSTPSTSASTSSNSTTSTCSNNSTNATTTSPQLAPPTRTHGPTQHIKPAPMTRASPPCCVIRHRREPSASRG